MHGTGDDGERALDATERQRVATLVGLVGDAPGGSARPIFAHMRLATAGRERDVLLGPRTDLKGRLPVVDWQRAPLSEVFFTAGEGETYEVEADGRTLEGTLLERNLLSFAGGRLTEVVTPGARLRRGTDGWRSTPLPRALLGPRPVSARARPIAPVDVPLDAVQRAAVGLETGRALLVLGEAGCGKTTVALHRLAVLHRRAQAAASRGGASGVPFRAVVLVPVEGLRRLTEDLLARLGCADVPVRRYEDWALEQARRVWPTLPARTSRDAAVGVVRCKRHGALAEALAVLARDRRAGPIGRAELLHLFGDRLLLDRVVAASSGAVGAADVAAVLSHTRVQFTATTEEEFADVVDAARLQTLDGRAIDDGTPYENAGTLDPEDAAVLFELSRLRAVAGGPPPAAPEAYDAVVVDEAQELAPLELALVGRALAPGGTLVVAGDAGQQVDPTACFGGWDATLAALCVGDAERVTLETVYRCPPAVTALARDILVRPGTPTPEDAPGDAGDAGDALAELGAPNGCHQAARLVDALRALRDADPGTTVAVICRRRETAHALAALLGRAIDVRLALDGAFRFRPGIDVTTVDEVKGLEFDHVIVPDAAAATWRDTPEDRRALYVAVTRALHQTTLAWVGTRTPLLTPQRPAPCAAA